MKQDLVLALVDAHYRHDDSRFRSLTMQAASHIRNESERARLLKTTELFVELPQEAHGLALPVPKAELDSLVLLGSLRSELVELAREERHRLGLMLRGIRSRCRLLFHGLPGNGKTVCASAFAGLLNRTAYVASLPTLIASHMGVTGANAQKLFAILRAGQILVVDEIDAIGSARIDGSSSSAADRERNCIVNTLLTLLDQTTDGILIATTNRPDLLDSALLRRFDAELEFPPPTDAMAAELSALLCSKFSIPRFVPECRASFDAITKAIVGEARRRALAELEREETPVGQLCLA
jgi:SpoVK/Ycf46/Vps4 family AAA+-type ATPase